LEDALDLHKVAFWLGLKGARGGNRAHEQGLLLDDAGHQM
jgi:hypothetical protein